MTLLLLACGADPGAPPDVAFDHLACDHCGMLVSEPRHAAVLRPRDAAERVFDDPGCLFEYVLAERPSIAQMWFHTEASWVREDAVSFLQGETTPMGSGLVAVPVGTPGSIGVGEASRIALSGARR
jgi:hypothetical protein